MYTELNTSKTFNDGAIAGFGTEVTATDALSKTSQSKNIDIAEWNTLVEAASRSEADVQRLYNVLKTIFPNIDEFVTALAESSASKEYVDDELAKKVNKLDKSGVVYTNDGSGKPSGKRYSVELKADTIPLRDEDGVLQDVYTHNQSESAHPNIRNKALNSVKVTYDDKSSTLTFTSKTIDGTESSEEIDLLLESLKVIAVDDFIDEDDENKRKLKIAFAEGDPIIVEFDEIFNGIDKLLADKADKTDVETALKTKANKAEVEAELKKKATNEWVNTVYTLLSEGIHDLDISTTEDINRTNVRVNTVNKRVDNLEGMLIKHTIDSTEAYTKKVPTDSAHKAILNRVGGKTLKYSKNICTDAVEGGIPFSIDVVGNAYTRTLPKGTYWISTKAEVDDKEEGSEWGINNIINNSLVTNPVTLEEEAEYRAEISGNGILNGRVYPMIIEYTEGTEIPTEYIPFDTSEYINLIPFPYEKAGGVGTVYTNNGIRFTIQEDGAFGVSGTSDDIAMCVLTVNSPILVDGVTYTLSSGSSGVRLFIKYIDEGANKFSSSTFTWKDSYTFVQLYLQIASGVTIDVNVYPMLNRGSTAMPFKPYEKYKLVPTKVTEIVSVGKNRLPSDVFNVSSWEQYADAWWKYNLDLPDGWYCITAKLKEGYKGDVFLYITKKGADGKYTSENAVYIGIGGKAYGYLITSTGIDTAPYWFKVDNKADEVYRLILNSATQAKLDEIDYIQIESVNLQRAPSSAYMPMAYAPPTEYSPYRRNSYPIPEDIQEKEGYGTDEGYIDFDRKKWVYDGGKEDISNILTDYPDYKFIEVEGKGEIIAVNEEKNPVPWTVTFAET